MEEHSPLFESIFKSNTSGCFKECDCGRVTFDCEGDWDWEEGELEGLIKHSQKDPDQCISVDYAVSSLIIDGHEIVIGCPCKTVLKYELFIRNEATKIAEFLNALSQQKKAYAAGIFVHFD